MKNLGRNLCFVFVSVLVLNCGGGGHPTGGGGGGLKLDSGTGGTPDLAMSAMPMPDLSMKMQGNLNGCNGAIGCINNCNDPNTSKMCIAACKAGTTTQGWNMLVALINCLFGGPMGMPAGACPSANGGVCDSASPNYVSADCDTCLMKAQSMGGACFTAIDNCSKDLP